MTEERIKNILCDCVRYGMPKNLNNTTKIRLKLCEVLKKELDNTLVPNSKSESTFPYDFDVKMVEDKMVVSPNNLYTFLRLNGANIPPDLIVGDSYEMKAGKFGFNKKTKQAYFEPKTAVEHFTLDFIIQPDGVTFKDNKDE